jgi:prolyl-tRNA synthetase
VKKLAKKLAKFRTFLDDRDHLTPGRKFNEWELKGVPLRVEFGPRDMKEKQAVLVRRDTGGKRTVRISDIEDEVAKELDAVQENLFLRASDALAHNTHEASSMDELKRILSEEGGIVRVHWCGEAGCEAKMKDETGGKVLNIPLDEKSKSKCISCGKAGSSIANFGKSY